MVELRAITLQTDIGAPAAAVWSALTDAVELMRWFPLQAEVQAGKGGLMRLSWGDPVVAIWRIEDWVAHRRLLAAEIRPLGVLLQPRNGDIVPRVVDLRFAPRDGHTALHLRHDGFGCGPQWDEVYGSVRRGWEFQMRSLRHYLERHAGAERSVARVRRTLSLPAHAVWERLAGPHGFFRNATEAPITVNCRCVAHLDHGETWSGVVHIFDPPRQFSMTLSTMNDALFRLYMVENAAGAAELSLWLASYDVPTGVVQEFQSRWADLFDRLFSSDRVEHSRAPA